VEKRVDNVYFFFEQLLCHLVGDVPPLFRFFAYTGAQINEYFLFHRASCQEEYINFLGDRDAIWFDMYRPVIRFVESCIKVHEADSSLSASVIVAMQLLMRPGFFVDRQMKTDVDDHTTARKEYQILFNECGDLCLKCPTTSADLKFFEDKLQTWNGRMAFKGKILPATLVTIEKLNDTIVLCINILQLKTNLFEVINKESTEQTYTLFAQQHWFLDVHGVADLDFIGSQEHAHEVYSANKIATEHVLQVLLTQNHVNAKLGTATPDGNCGYLSIAHYFNTMLSGTAFKT
jgi:hypothetical protein